MNTVELIGTYGGDVTHALSAWTSTRRELTDEKRERMGKLLTMLATEGHHTPFEKSMLHFLVRCDTASHIHLIKHRIGVSVNGESARYKEITPSFHIPWDWPPHLQDRLEAAALAAQEAYQAALEELTPVLGRKRAKESARFFLPYSNQLTLDISFNFRSFMHFQGLRNDDHAQDEIHKIAMAMIELVRDTGQFNDSLAAFHY